MRRTLVLAVGMVLTLSAAAAAHHSYAAVDTTKRATVQGTVTALEWTNPHVWVWIAATDRQGTRVPYAFESLAPAELSRFFGWTRHSLIPGQPVTIDYAPFRNGDRGGALSTITFADGRVLRGRQAPPNGGAQGPR